MPRFISSAVLQPTPVAKALTVLGAAALLPLGAQAQAPQQAGERIVVTGSNVKRLDAETSAPIETIDRQAIERSPAATVGELLRGISSNAAGSYSETSINNQSGAAGVSLRGLGQKSTLVLLNGRRVANHAIAQNGQDTFVDLNSIPKSAIQRIEVLKDGASAIYGSDAIAGVVNIILRNDLDGVTIGGSAGESTQGGLSEQSLNLSGGMKAMGGKLSLMGVVDVFSRSMMTLGDRPYLNGLDFRFLPGGTYFPGASGGTWQRTVVTGTTVALRREAIPNCLGGSKSMDSLIGAGVYTGTACTYSVDKYLTAFPEANRLGFLGRATYDLGGGSELFAEASLADNKSYWINQPQTLTNQTVVFNPSTGGFSAYSNIIPAIATDPQRVALFATNPLGGNGTTARFNTTFFDVGARTFDLETKTTRAMVGMRGTMAGWDWEGAVGYSQSKVDSTTGNQVDALALRNVLTNGGYNFLNPSESDTAKLRVATSRQAQSKLTTADIKATTTLGQLAGGAMGVAVGLEVRNESMSNTADPLVQQGRLLGTGSSSYDGSRSASALYAELVAPVTKQLEVQLAGRADSYSDFGSAFSPKVGAKFNVTPQMLLRASHAKGFRAPTLVENTASASLGFDSVLDPLRNNASSVIGVLNTGSKGLKAEKSTSTTLGLAIEPTKNTTLTLDMYEIEQANLVALNGAQFIVRNPTLFPGAVVRDATNTILVVYDNYSNLANIKTKGMDLELSARLPANPLGRFGLRGTWTRMTSYDYQAKEGVAAVDYAGRNDGPFGAMPKSKMKFAVDWSQGAWTATLGANYIGSYEQKGTTNPAAAPRVESSTTFDAFAAYSFSKTAKLSLSIKNLTDRMPPWDVATGLGYSTGQYDLRGRFVRLGGEFKF